MQFTISSPRQAFGAAIAGTILMIIAPAVSQGAVVFYATRALFNAAEPGLPVQGFASANLYGQPFVTEPNGLNSATNDSVFAAGSILLGLTISTLHPGAASTALEVYGGSVGNFWFGDTLVLSFAPGVSAVAEDVFANTSYGSSFAGNIHETVLDGSVGLGSTTLTEGAGGSVFIGVASTQPITSVEITWASDGDASTFVNNIAFGTESSPVPEPPGLVLLGLSAIVLGFGSAARRA